MKSAATPPIVSVAVVVTPRVGEVSSFTITSVRVVGPLWGLQSKNGYDMRPDSKLTPAQLARYFTPWWYAPRRMVWDHKFISVQP